MTKLKLVVNNKKPVATAARLLTTLRLLQVHMIIFKEIPAGRITRAQQGKPAVRTTRRLDARSVELLQTYARIWKLYNDACSAAPSPAQLQCVHSQPLTGLELLRQRAAKKPKNDQAS